MENLKILDIHSEYKQERKVEKSLIKSNSRSISKYYLLKKKLVAIFGLVSVIMFILLSVGYTEMLNIQSNNKILTRENSNLVIEKNNLIEIVKPYRDVNRIRKIAADNLNMKMPDIDSYALIKNEGNIVSLSDFNVNDIESDTSPSILKIFSNIFR